MNAGTDESTEKKKQQQQRTGRDKGLRDQFASMALMGYLASHPGLPDTGEGRAHIAELSYLMADAMEEERAKDAT